MTALFVMVNESRQLLRYFCESLFKITRKGMGLFMLLWCFIWSVNHYRIHCLVSAEQFSVYCSDTDKIVKLAVAKDSTA